MTKPRISVIMPVLNRGDMIAKAIQSVIDQQYENTELIILDGGSTDNTIEIIRQYEKHITYWHSKRDGSAAVATNIGIEKASGDVLALLMSDDYYEAGLFHKIAQAFHEHPEADVFTCAGRVMTMDGLTLSRHDSAQKLDLNVYNICYSSTNICFRFISKSLYQRIGLYIPFHHDQKQMLTNDKEFLLRAVLSGVNSIYVDHLGYTHVAHQGSYSFGNHPSTFLRHCMEHMDIAEKYLARKKLGWKRRLFFMAWYNDQSARLFLFRLLKRDFAQAIALARHGVKKYTLIWPMFVCATGCRAVVKKFIST